MILIPSARAGLPMEVDGTNLPSLAPMVDRVTPAVVNIATEGRVQVRQNPLLNDPFFKRFFNIPEQPRERKTQSLGTGVIIDAKRGLVVTNNHVIANAHQITVKLRDGRNFQAEIIGSDPETDVAVIKIPAEHLMAVERADSDELRVGDFVVAIGNPFGLGQTVTSGIVSALGRTGLGIEGYEDFIQTDASINPGNSGGALVNLRGELVGINTAIFSQSGGNVGIGFAIPINMVNMVTEQLVEYGEVHRGLIGAQTQDLDSDLADAFGIDQRAGAVVVDIAPGSPAEKADLKPGDVITMVNGKQIKSSSDIRTRIGLLRVGEKVEFTVVRNNKELKLFATVADIKDLGSKSNLQNPRLAGATFGEIPKKSPAYGRLKGVMLFEVEQGSPLWVAGLRDGDIITSVNRTLVEHLDSFLQIVNSAKNERMLFRVQRGNQAAYIVLK
ncbi:MAG: DegQ family serine endoprotease [Gammaproteobacteria bacterium]